MRKATIKWKQFKSYDSAMGSYECIYLFVSNDQPNYAGICYKSVFGGSKRMVGNRERSPRYGGSYRHFIDGFIAEGGKLYIGKCLRAKPSLIKPIESSLIYYQKPRYNRQVLKPAYRLSHKGDIPQYLL